MMNYRTMCNCQSGLAPRDVYDARNIYVAQVCDACESRKLSGYRPEIFTDAHYATTERIEDDF
jgi:hypothetical protein